MTMRSNNECACFTPSSPDRNSRHRGCHPESSSKRRGHKPTSSTWISRAVLATVWVASAATPTLAGGTYVELHLPNPPRPSSPSPPSPTDAAASERRFRRRLVKREDGEFQGVFFPSLAILNDRNDEGEEEEEEGKEDAETRRAFEDDDDSSDNEVRRVRRSAADGRPRRPSYDPRPGINGIRDVDEDDDGMFDLNMPAGLFLLKEIGSHPEDFGPEGSKVQREILRNANFDDVSVGELLMSIEHEAYEEAMAGLDRSYSMADEIASSYSLTRQAYLNVSKLLTPEEMSYRRLLTSSQLLPSSTLDGFNYLDDSYQPKMHRTRSSGLSGVRDHVRPDKTSDKSLFQNGNRQKWIGQQPRNASTHSLQHVRHQQHHLRTHVREKRLIGLKLAPIAAMKVFMKILFCDPFKCCLKYKLLPKKLIKIPCCLKKKIWCCICLPL